MPKNKKYDFGGWATRNDLLCSDGRVIKKDAFKECDGTTVPLVWNHNGTVGPDNILGYAILHNMDDGVYCYGTFNDTQNGTLAKSLVRHGDITSLSIYANKLKQIGKDVVHGSIREVSLVLAGANPGAYIDTIIAHSDSSEEEAIIYNDSEGIDTEISHADDKEKDGGNIQMADDSKKTNEKTVGEIFDSLTEEQKTVVYAMIGEILEENEGDEEKDMKHNCFEGDACQDDGVLTHAEIESIFKDAKRIGSLKEAVLQHSDGEDLVPYGIDNIDYLFPDDRAVTNTPMTIQRDMTWVDDVMGKVHHVPFSKIKSILADLTEDQARARGYIKGKYKKEEVFSLLKRSTSPTTVYKKQKLDRDDIVDITDFDVVSWLKGEMRMMLNEELARAFLIGDGRLSSDDDKIAEDHIRPIWTDNDLYAVHKDFADNGNYQTRAKRFIDCVIRSRKDYKGSGNPTMYMTEDLLTDCLLLEDNIGRKIYKTADELATTLRVSKIVTVPVMENQVRDDKTLCGIMVNLVDYNVGADKGGSVNMFEDFDIDFNAQKYLIETRCSGALVKPFSAIVFESVTEVPGLSENP